MPNLENIVLRDNRFKTLPEDLFAQSTMLEKVDLSKNELTRVSRLFDHCSNLYSVISSDNSEIEDANLFDIVQRLAGLSYLWLANTKPELSAMAPQTHPTQFPLTHLNLAKNRLTDPNILKLLTSLQSLNTNELQQNQLKRLELIDDIKNVFPQFSKINLQYNNLNVQTKLIFEAANIQVLA